jgi:cell wall-associated NlpC family hydrolase
LEDAVSGEMLALNPAVPRAGRLRRYAMVFTALALAMTIVSLEAPAVALGRSPQSDAAVKGNDAQRVVRLALRHVGARFRMGTEGHRTFDCSGLVFRVYQMAGLINKIGGGRKGATAYYNWFRKRGQVSRSNPKPGDLVAYGRRNQNSIPHMGIYIGNGRVVSALVNPWGVRVHTLNWLNYPFKAFMHVDIDR